MEGASSFGFLFFDNIEECCGESFVSETYQPYRVRLSGLTHVKGVCIGANLILHSIPEQRDKTVVFGEQTHGECVWFLKNRINMSHNLPPATTVAVVSRSSRWIAYVYIIWHIMLIFASFYNKFYFFLLFSIHKGMEILSEKKTKLRPFVCHQLLLFLGKNSKIS